MNKSLTLGKIFNIPILLHWSLPASLFLMVATTSYRDGWAKALVLITVNFLGFSIITLHELGHGLAAKYCQKDVDSITLTCIGGIALIDQVDKCNPKERMLISVAGPLVNILLALTGLLLIGFPNFQHIREFLINPLTGWKGIYGTGFVLNAIILAFNLIPIYPMDGGRIIQDLGEMFFSKKAGRVAGIISCLAMGIPIALFLAYRQLVLPAVMLGSMAVFGIFENLQRLHKNKD